MTAPGPGSPVEDALDRLAGYLARPDIEYVGSAADVATVRGEMASLTAAVERLTEERDEAEDSERIARKERLMYFEKFKAAEAENARLSSLLETIRQILRKIAADEVWYQTPAQFARAFLAASPGSGDPPGGWRS